MVLFPASIWEAMRESCGNTSCLVVLGDNCNGRRSAKLLNFQVVSLVAEQALAILESRELASTEVAHQG